MTPTVDPKLVFELIRDEFGRFSARCLNARIRSQGDDLEELHENLTAAIEAYFPGETPPSGDEVHFVMFHEPSEPALA